MFSLLQSPGTFSHHFKVVKVEGNSWRVWEAPWIKRSSFFPFAVVTWFLWPIRFYLYSHKYLTNILIHSLDFLKFKFTISPWGWGGDWFLFNKNIGSCIHLMKMFWQARSILRHSVHVFFIKKWVQWWALEHSFVTSYWTHCLDWMVKILTLGECYIIVVNKTNWKSKLMYSDLTDLFPTSSWATFLFCFGGLPQYLSIGFKFHIMAYGTASLSSPIQRMLSSLKL